MPMAAAPAPASFAPPRGRPSVLGRLAGAVGSAFSGGGAPPPPAAYRQVDRAPAPAMPTLFSGVPQFAGGEAVLFDTGRAEDASKLTPQMLTRLRLRLTGGAVDSGRLDPDLAILIFVGDLAAPRARVRVADLLRQGGERPLNLAWSAGQPLRIVLHDPQGTWARQAPALELTLG
jgi:Ca-activated chloride channel family protein